NVIKLRDLQDLFAFPSLEDEANRQVIVRYLQDSNSILIEDDNNISFRESSSLEHIGDIEGSLPSLQVMPDRSNGINFLRISPHDSIVFWSLKEDISPLISDIQSQVDYIRISSNTQRIMLVEDDDVSIWNYDGEFLFNLETSDEHSTIKDVYFHSGDEKVIGFSKDKIFIWDLKDGSLIKRFSAHDKKVEKIFLIPRSGEIVSVGDDNLIKIWNENGKLISKLVGHTNKVEDVTFSNDGNLIASRSYGWTRSDVKLWSSDAKIIHESNVLTWGRGDLHFSPDSQVLVVNNAYAGIELWHVESKDTVPLLGHVGQVNEVIFTSDNKLIISAGEDNTIRIWDRNEGTAHPTVYQDFQRSQSAYVSAIGTKGGNTEF
ncbi:MAG: hypothetical protein F6K30_31080, partial [Cyanothece sp. SIO2G6]|nr:hypothetical protein [Cyanothece sp. SIO2G6]